MPRELNPWKLADYYIDKLVLFSAGVINFYDLKDAERVVDLHILAQLRGL